MKRPDTPTARRIGWLWLLPLLLTIAGAIERMPTGTFGKNWFGESADDARAALHDYMTNH